jgi:hypothetical protein
MVQFQVLHGPFVQHDAGWDAAGSENPWKAKVAVFKTLYNGDLMGPIYIMGKWALLGKQFGLSWVFFLEYNAP